MFKKLSLVVVSLALVFSTASVVYALEDITPADAYDAAASDPNTYIIDVRTIAEWKWVGHPWKNKAGEGADLIDDTDPLNPVYKVVNISYKLDKPDGTMVENKWFLWEVKKRFGDNPDAVLIMMCRSGKRSVLAGELLKAKGFNVKNMVTGFEGGGDGEGYRTKPGWKNDGLPYKISADEGYIHPVVRFMKQYKK